MLNPEEVKRLMDLNPKLHPQSYDQIGQLSPISPYVIGRQATINIGTIGHVSHGKTTVVRAISGVNTIKSSEEMKNNITMKLGYANTKIYRCPKCPEPYCYQSYGSQADDEKPCPNKIADPENPDNEIICHQTMLLLRHISFVDCPGHDNLMAIMLTGAAVMDAALLLIAGNMPCPQPQTSEHLAAVDIMDLNRIIILQNKIDLVFNREGEAMNNYQQIRNFIRGTKAENSPIIPISAQFKYNVEVVLQYLVSYIPVPMRDLTSNPRFMIVRSFDVNKPGCPIEKLTGGIAGGSILAGVLKVGDEIEIRPGICSKNPETNEVTYTPIVSTVVTMRTEDNELLYAIPGGLIAVGLKVDPFLTKRDALVGNLMGHRGLLPEIFITLQIKYSLLRRLIGVRSESSNTSNDSIQKIAKDETLMINVGTTSMGCKVTGVNSAEGVIKVELTKGVCTSVGDKVALSRRINNKFRLIGWGEIVKGKRYKGGDDKD